MLHVRLASDVLRAKAARVQRRCSSWRKTSRRPSVFEQRMWPACCSSQARLQAISKRTCRRCKPPSMATPWIRYLPARTCSRLPALGEELPMPAQNPPHAPHGGECREWGGGGSGTARARHALAREDPVRSSWGRGVHGEWQTATVGRRVGAWSTKSWAHAAAGHTHSDQDVAPHPWSPCSGLYAHTQVSAVRVRCWTVGL